MARIGVDRAAESRREHDVVAAALQRAADDLLRVAVGIRRVEEGDAGIERAVDDARGTTLEPQQALGAWLERFTRFVGTKRGRLLDQLVPALQQLLLRAADGGRIRDDVSARDVLTTVALLCQPVPGEDATFSLRMLRVFVDGLRRG